MSKHIISASEMERYGYCPLSWHLDLKGIDAEGEEVTSGVEKHKEIGTSLTNLLVEEKKSRETSSTLLTEQINLNMNYDIQYQFQLQS